MRTGLSSVAIVSVVLAVAGCASQGTSTTSAPQATPDGEGTKVNARVGNFRRTTKNGQTLYCEKAEFVGSKMTKTRCLTEGEFKTLQERNAEMINDLERAQRASQPVSELPSK
jgi:hypothetical protein